MRSNGLKPDRITAYHTRRWEQKGEEIQERKLEKRYAQFGELSKKAAKREQAIAEATHRMLYGSENPF